MLALARIRLRPKPDEIVRLKTRIAKLEGQRKALDRDLGRWRKRQERLAYEMALKPVRLGQTGSDEQIRFDILDRIIARRENEYKEISTRLLHLKEVLRENQA